MQTLAGKKILVVDDNQVILKALSSMLQSNGGKVFTALDGSEAISIMRREKPDLILLDLIFPPNVAQGGMVWDGFIIIEWLRRMGEAGNVPIIVISGADPKKYKERCLAAGVRAFFSKPLEMKKLVETIQAVLSDDIKKTAEVKPVDFEV